MQDNQKTTDAASVDNRRTCGGCTLCCRMLSIHELVKPAHVWCEFCQKGVGCRIYADRPGSCRGFSCTWLVNEWMPESVRPDRCKVVFEGTAGHRTIAALVDPGRPDAYLRHDVQAVIAVMVRHGMTVLVFCAGRVLGAYCADGVDPNEAIDDLARIVTEQNAEIAARTGRTVEEVERERAVLTASAARR